MQILSLIHIYLFKRDTGFSTAYIGSSNLSNPALTGGLEWNVKVTEKESFDIVKKFSVSFESYWNDASFETFDPENPDCHEKLKKELTRAAFDRKSKRSLQVSIRPYAYQQEILDNLAAEREVYGHYRNPVSYTHLDVYKRQMRIMPCLFFIVMSCTERKKKEKTKHT